MKRSGATPVVTVNDTLAGRSPTMSAPQPAARRILPFGH